jgi:hypothetical protein
MGASKKGKRMGRPPVPEERQLKVVSIRMDDTTVARVQRIAEECDLTWSKALRAVIDEGIEAAARKKKFGR